METFLRIIGWLLALIVLPVAAVSIIVFLLLNAVSTSAATPQTVLDTLAEQEFYEEITPDVLPAILEQIPGTALDRVTTELRDIVQGLPEDQLRELSNELIPADWLQTQVASAINQMMESLREGTSQNIQLDLEAVRQQLSGASGARIAGIIIDNAPACTPEQNEELLTLLQEDPDARPILGFICNPPAQYQEFMIRVVRRAQNSLAENLQGGITNPFSGIDLQGITVDTITDVLGMESSIAVLQTSFLNITFELPESDSAVTSSTTTFGQSTSETDAPLDGEPTEPNETLQLIQTLLVSCGIPLIILTFFILFLVRTLRGLSIWWGWTTLFSGVGLLLVVLTLNSFIGNILNGLSANASIQNTIALQGEILRGLLNSIVPTTQNALMIQGGVLVVIGVILLLGAWLLPRWFGRNDPNPEDFDEFHSDATQEIPYMRR